MNIFLICLDLNVSLVRMFTNKLVVANRSLNLNLKRRNKIKSVFRKKNTISFNSDEKKKSYNMPKWILFNKNLFDDCPSYLEVDYFTLSSFVLYEPFL